MRLVNWSGERGPILNEIAGFARIKDGMSGGWGKGYAIIDEILSELQAA